MEHLRGTLSMRMERSRGLEQLANDVRVRCTVASSRADFIPPPLGRTHANATSSTMSATCFPSSGCAHTYRVTFHLGFAALLECAC